MTYIAYSGSASNNSSLALRFKDGSTEVTSDIIDGPQLIIESDVDYCTPSCSGFEEQSQAASADLQPCPGTDPCWRSFVNRVLA